MFGFEVKLGERLAWLVSGRPQTDSPPPSPTPTPEGTLYVGEMVTIRGQAAWGVLVGVTGDGSRGVVHLGCRMWSPARNEYILIPTGLKRTYARAELVRGLV